MACCRLARCWARSAVPQAALLAGVAHQALVFRAGIGELVAGVLDLPQQLLLADPGHRLPLLDHVAHRDQDLLDLAIFRRHQARHPTLAQEDPLAPGLRGNGAEDAPGDGSEEEQPEGSQREPAPRSGHLQELVELLGRGQPFERHLAEDHGSPPAPKGIVVS